MTSPSCISHGSSEANLPSRLCVSLFIFVLYIHEHLYKIWLSYYVMLNLIKVQHMYIWPGKQLKISVGLGREGGLGRGKGRCGETHTFFISLGFLELNTGPRPPVELHRGRKHAAFKSEVASDCFWNVLVYLEAARLAIHALDCTDKPFPYAERLRWHCNTLNS